MNKRERDLIADLLKMAKPENHAAIPAKTPLEEWEYTIFVFATHLKDKYPDKVDSIEFLKRAGY